MVDVEIKILTGGDLEDFVGLLKTFEVVFEMENLHIPDQHYLLNLLRKPEFMCLVAKCEGQVIGGLTVHVLPNYYNPKPVAFAYDLGIQKEFQRKGIGKKLIGRLVEYCKENEFDHAFVEAETEDQYAVDFYRSTPVTSELNAVHFTYRFEEVVGG